MGHKYHYGLIGKQLSHSFSQNYFEEKFASESLSGYSYELIELESLNELKQIADEKELDGFNVTIPYKVEMLPLLDDIDDTARKIGAVNCVKVIREDVEVRLKGYNTDAPAFADTLQNSKFDIRNSKALILGTGGAAQAVAYGLEMLGIEYMYVSRNPSHSNIQDSVIGYDEAYQLTDEYTIIVNATPVGMFPNSSCSPWTHPELLTNRHICYDLIYNPSPTRFMQEAAMRGATVQDGLPMLHRQAELSWEIWQ